MIKPGHVYIFRGAEPNQTWKELILDVSHGNIKYKVISRINMPHKFISTEEFICSAYCYLGASNFYGLDLLETFKQKIKENKEEVL